MAEIDVATDPPLGPQPFNGGVHVDGVPGDDGIRDQVEAEDLIRLLICLTALYLPFVSEEQEAAQCVEGFSLVQLAVDSTTIIRVLNPP